MQKTTNRGRWLYAVAIPLLAHSTQALELYGLTQSGDRLIKFNENGAVSGSLNVTGLQPGDSLQDIDTFFSGDGKLYGIGSSGTLYTINRDTGAATVNVSTPAVGSPTAIDFNPAADRLRIFSGDSNYRLTPNTGAVSPDGTLAFAAADVNFGVDPSLVAAAYINNVDLPPGTALYSIDSDLNALILHSGGPQFSALNTVASLTLDGNPFDIGAAVGFDVFSPSAGNNWALLSNGNDLYSLNLASGALSSLGTVATGELLRSFAVTGVPDAGASLPCLGAVFAGLVWFRKRLQSS